MRRSALVLLILFVSWPAWAQQRVALVIGNGAYATLPRLPNPPTDAKAIAARLGQLGFDVAAGTDLSKAAMDQALRAFGRRAEQADVAMVFYAGHGVQVGGRNYLVPVDAALPTREQDLRYDFVDVAAVMEELAGARQLRIVVLDACRDNPIPAELHHSVGRGLATEHGLAAPPGLDNTLIAYATATDAIAEDGSGADSPFTTALLHHLDDPGLDIRLMFGRVRDEVRRATGNRQNPFVYESLGGDAFYFHPATETAAAASPPDQVAALTQPRGAQPVPQSGPAWAAALAGRWRLADGRACTTAYGIATVQGDTILFEWRLPNGRLNAAVERVVQVAGTVVTTTVLSDVGTGVPEAGHRVRYEFEPDRWRSENLVTHERATHLRC